MAPGGPGLTRGGLVSSFRAMSVAARYADRPKPLKVCVFGVGSFAHSTLGILSQAGADVMGYLTRDYAHDPPKLVARTISQTECPNPVPRLREEGVDLIVPMSIDWAQKPWAAELLASGIPIFCPTGEALRLERERDFARQLCAEYGIPFPKSHFVANRKEAEAVVHDERRAYVIKNPLCGPFSPVHTIVCETVEDTLSWLARIDYREGVFLQEYVGRAEVGHIALVSGGEVVSLVTNQEYKRAFNGNLGIVAGAPLGGLVECDPDDRYRLAARLVRPLLPWFRSVGFHGPVQVTAAMHRGKWTVLEYNVRIGVTSGAMILRMLKHPLETLRAVASNEPVAPEFKPRLQYGCSITLAGYGYPYTQLNGPEVPLVIKGKPSCDVWLNEVRVLPDGSFLAAGHRIADVVAFGGTMPEAVFKADANIRSLRCLGSYHRTDIGQSLWPPGSD